MNNKHFLTFADKRWTVSHERFSHDLNCIQQQLNYFKSYDIVDEDYCTDEYKQKFQPYWKDHGFGWWSWKPDVILKKLEQIDDNDVLFFLDGGCSFPMSNIKLFFSTLDIFIDSLDFFDIALTNNRVKCQTITLSSVLDNFNLSNNLYFRTIWPNWQSGIILCKKNKKITTAVKQWRDYYFQHIEDFHNYRKENEIKNRPYFQKLCADQTVLQCILFNARFNIMNMTNFIYDNGIVTRIRK